ncbi:hypothetical protein [Clostridium uliginosum]|uniref:hypothetical protein n=1 Tax=Clostridium uliginosum TaxID=119641 RepID=UPI000B7C82B9|nr:hypothetical protein [Clostridium uliginosum]
MKNRTRFFATLGLAVMCAVPTFWAQAHDRETYTQPVYGGQNNFYGSVNTKETSNLVVFNKVTNDWDSFDTITSWVSNKDKKQISEDYYLAEGDAALMDHKDVSKVRLSFENSKWLPMDAKVTGEVDYY